MRIKRFKTLIAVVLSAAMILASLVMVSVGADTDALKGDIDNNGQVAPADETLLRNFLGGRAEFDAGQLERANVYCADDVVDMRDLYYLRRLRLTGDLPTCCAIGIPPEWRIPAIERQIFNESANRTVPAYSVLVNQVGYTAGGPKIMRMTEGGSALPAGGTSTGGDTRVPPGLPALREAPLLSHSLVHNANVILFDIDNDEIAARFTASARRTFTIAENMGVATVDFSSFTTPGRYRFYTPIGASQDFVISENPHQEVALALVRGLHYQRCGIALPAGTVTPGNERNACHVMAEGGGYLDGTRGTGVCNSGACAQGAVSQAQDSSLTPLAAEYLDPNLPVAGNEVMIMDTFDPAAGRFRPNRDTSLPARDPSTGISNVVRQPATRFAGGHHDAGDYGRYISPAAATLADLVYAWELTPEVFEEQDYFDDNPGENLPDILDEARWMGEWLIRMQAIPEDGGPASSVGGFYFKMCTNHFASENGSLPVSDAQGQPGDRCFNRWGLRVAHVNLHSTVFAAGALASAAYTFRDIDPDFSARALESARKGFEFLTSVVHDSGAQVGSVIADNPEATARSSASPHGLSVPRVGGGAYGGAYFQQQWWLAVALYRATGGADYRTFINDFFTRRDGANLVTCMTETHGGGFGTLAYLLMSMRDADNGIPTNPREDIVNRAVQSFTARANSNDSSLNTCAFNISMSSQPGSRPFPWGSNSHMSNEVRSHAVLTALGMEDRTAGLRNVLNWWLGVNPRGFSQITRVGSRYPRNIHHFPSNVLRNRGVLGVPGLLAGGYTNDSSAQWNSPAVFYWHDRSDWVANEICIYWNSTAAVTAGALAAADMAAMN